MSAELTAPLPHPRGDAADDTIRRTVHALIRGRALKVEDVAKAVGMTPATLYRRLAGEGRKQAFAAGEVADLAGYFGVKVEELYAGLGGLFTPPPVPPEYTGSNRQYLRLVGGGFRRNARPSFAPSVTPRTRRVAVA